MVHRFHLDDFYLVVDPCSASVHAVDEMAYEVIGRYEEKSRQEITAELEESMFGHYRTLGLLDCGIKPMDALVEGTRMIADGLHLRQQIIPASVAYLEQLLTGPWPDERFVCLRGGEEITSETLTLSL